MYKFIDDKINPNETRKLFFQLWVDNEKKEMEILKLEKETEILNLKLEKETEILNLRLEKETEILNLRLEKEKQLNKVDSLTNDLARSQLTLAAFNHRALIEFVENWKMDNITNSVKKKSRKEKWIDYLSSDDEGAKNSSNALK